MIDDFDARFKRGCDELDKLYEAPHLKKLFLLVEHQFVGAPDVVAKAEVSEGVSEKVMRRDIKKVLEVKNRLSCLRDKELQMVRDKYLKLGVDKGVNVFDRALTGLTHKYVRGDFVFAYIYDKLLVVRIEGHTPRGYKVFSGNFSNGSGTRCVVLCSRVVCLAQDSARIKKEILLNKI